jgi:hypothetical protein
MGFFLTLLAINVYSASKRARESDVHFLNTPLDYKGTCHISQNGQTVKIICNDDLRLKVFTCASGDIDESTFLFDFLESEDIRNDKLRQKGDIDFENQEIAVNEKIIFPCPAFEDIYEQFEAWLNTIGRVTKIRVFDTTSMGMYPEIKDGIDPSRYVQHLFCLTISESLITNRKRIWFIATFS